MEELVCWLWATVVDLLGTKKPEQPRTNLKEIPDCNGTSDYVYIKNINMASILLIVILIRVWCQPKIGMVVVGQTNHTLNAHVVYY